MKEFAVYTGLRLAMFVSTFVVVTGVWLLLSDDAVEILWPLLIALIISAIGSAYLLKGPRDRFAAKIEERARKASAKFEEIRSKEDVD